MLQNRVDPFGNLICTPARGAWMGNRGILHNDKQEITRPFRLKAWLICRLEFNGRHRAVMSPNRYTELFFLDEATAFSAGHRPCFECRRSDFNHFKSCWLRGNTEYGFDERTSMQKIDDILHKERINRYNLKVTYKTNRHDIPDGTFILWNGDPYAIQDGMMRLWTPSGYTSATPLPDTGPLTVLTPKSVVRAFSAGYQPQLGIGLSPKI